MRVLHVLFGGNIGGIEKLCLNFAKKQKDYGFIFIKNEGELIEKFQAVNENIYIFSNAHRVTLFEIDLLVKYINAIALNNNYDSIVFHHSGAFIWLTAKRLKKKNKRLKILIYAHSNLEDLFVTSKSILKTYMNKLSFYFAANKVDGIIAISEFVLHSIIKQFPSLGNKVHINYNGIELDAFLLLDKEKSFDKLRLVYVGRLIEQKGVQDVIKSLADCDGLLYTFDIIGDGPYRNTLELLVKNLSLSKKITFLGAQDNIASILLNYDYFIHLPQKYDIMKLPTAISAIISALAGIAAMYGQPAAECGAGPAGTCREISGNGPQYAVIGLSVNFLREAPDYTAELGTQALMGDIVEIVDRAGYWCKVVTEEPYTAWCTDLGLVPMDASELEEYRATPKYICTAWKSAVYSCPSMKSLKISGSSFSRVSTSALM